MYSYWDFVLQEDERGRESFSLQREGSAVKGQRIFQIFARPSHDAGAIRTKDRSRHPVVMVEGMERSIVMGGVVRIVVRSGGGVGGVVRDEGEEGKKGEGVKKKCAGSG